MRENCDVHAPGGNNGVLEVCRLVGSRLSDHYFRSVCLFSPLDSSEDFMARGGLLFSLSLIVSEL